MVRLQDQLCLPEHRHLRYPPQRSGQKRKETVFGVMTAICIT